MNLSVKAIRLLEISEQLQTINNELKTLINAPERAKRATQKDKDINFLKRNHERRTN